MIRQSQLYSVKFLQAEVQRTAFPRRILRKKKDSEYEDSYQTLLCLNHLLNLCYNCVAFILLMKIIMSIERKCFHSLQNIFLHNFLWRQCTLLGKKFGHFRWKCSWTLIPYSKCFQKVLYFKVVPQDMLISKWKAVFGGNMSGTITNDSSKAVR